MTAATATAALRHTWSALDGDAGALSFVRITDTGPVLPSSYAVDDAATAATAAAALAAAECWYARSGERQDVQVDTRNAAIAFRSERLVRVDGSAPGELWHPVAGTYRAADDRWIQLHVNFPHHLERAVAVLGVAPDPDAVAKAVATWPAEELESAVTEAGGCAAATRSRAEWLAHPHFPFVAAQSLVCRVAGGEGPALPEVTVRRPLSGLRVLDLTRVLAGPICARTLAGYGADVVRVIAPHLPEVEAALPDTALGKRTVELDLRARDDAETLRSMIAEADVFVQSYRPGALDALGFGADDVAATRPGIVHVSLSAYGDEGPWGGRRGYDSLVQTATGVTCEEATTFGSERPRHLPAQVLDHASGYLTAAAAMLALTRRRRDGLGARISCSLARTREWLESLGRVDNTGVPDPGPEDVADLMMRTGRVTHVRPAASLSETPVHW